VTTENPTQPKASKDSFVHLHVHTEYSMLDGAARIGDLVEEVARQEMPAIAMTDHGNVIRRKCNGLMVAMMMSQAVAHIRI